MWIVAVIAFHMFCSYGEALSHKVPAARVVSLTGCPLPLAKDLFSISLCIYSGIAVMAVGNIMPLPMQAIDAVSGSPR